MMVTYDHRIFTEQAHDFKLKSASLERSCIFSPKAVTKNHRETISKLDK